METDLTPKPSRFGVLGGAGVAWLVVAVVGLLMVSLSRGILADPSSALADFALKLGIAVAAAGVFFLLLSLWRGRSAQRDQNLAKKLGATVFSSVQTPQLIAVLQYLHEVGVLEQRAKPPLGFSLAADANGAQVWTGSPTKPKKLFQIDWLRIIAIVPSVTQEIARSSRGLSFIVQVPGGEIDVPFIITGSGLGKLFPLSETQIAAIIETLEIKRTASRSEYERTHRSEGTQ